MEDWASFGMFPTRPFLFPGGWRTLCPVLFLRYPSRGWPILRRPLRKGGDFGIIPHHATRFVAERRHVDTSRRTCS